MTTAHETTFKPKITVKKITSCDTDTIEKIYRLRYQVYCEERGYIDKGNHALRLEYDEYDEQSVHFAAFDDAGELIATLRMILPGKLPLPVEHLSPNFFKTNTTPMCAELSRLIHSRQPPSRETISANDPPPPVTLIDDVLLKIFHELYQESARLGITHWFALMEPSLHRLLKCYGFTFKRIGAAVEFYGKVYPFIGSVDRNKHALFQLLNSQPQTATI